MRTTAALSCPRCAAGLSVASSSFLDCRACGSPLAVLIPGEPLREAILPGIDGGQALDSVRRFWADPLVGPGFLKAERWDPPQLVFASFYEAERTWVSRDGLIETHVAAPAVEAAPLSLDALDGAAVLSGERRGFDPVALQRRGLVLDPSRRVEEALPTKDSPPIAERLAIVYVPIWLLRRRLGNNLYETAVDGVSGVPLGGRAPVERTARLGEAIAIVYVLAAILASLPVWGLWYFNVLTVTPDYAVPLAFASIAGLFWLLAWSWDRIRFRYELVAAGATRRLRPINRPERTLAERIAIWVASKM